MLEELGRAALIIIDPITAYLGTTDSHKNASRSPWVFPSENPDTHVDPRNFYRRVYLPKVKETGLEGVTRHGIPSPVDWP